jgi:hypothetical protein
VASNRPNKQKRQRQNRQEREARRARSERAGEATAISRGEREAAAQRASTTRTAAKGAKDAKDAKGKGSGWRRRESPYKIPGQRAVVMAFMFTIVSAFTLLIAPVQMQQEVPADDPVLQEIDEDDIRERDEEAGTVTYVYDAKVIDEEDPAVAAGILLTPIAITGIALLYTKKPQRSTAWTMAMVALAGFVFLFAGPYGIITLPSMIALAVGGFQSRRAEGKERLAQIRAEKAGRDGEVIDVEATEEPASDAAEVPGEEVATDEPGGEAAVDDPIGRSSSVFSWSRKSRR